MSRAVYETDQTDQADHTLKAPAGPQAGGRMRRQLVVGGAIVAVAMLVIGIIVLTSGSTSSKRTVRSRGSLSTPSAGILTTAAGDGNEGFAGDGKPALVAHLSRPSGVAVDRAGGLYIADQGNRRVRKVDTSGLITTIAGDGQGGYSGDGGPALRASINPSSVVVADDGTVYVADQTSRRVRRVKQGIITTVAGDGQDIAPNAPAAIGTPRALTIDADGSLLIATVSPNEARILRVAKDGKVSTVAHVPSVDKNLHPTVSGPTGLALAGNVLYVAVGQGDIYAMKNTSLVPIARVGRPVGLSGDTYGNLFVSDETGHEVLRRAPDGKMSVVAGNGQPWTGGNTDGQLATNTSINPGALAVDPSGTLYVVDGSDRVRKIVGATAPQSNAGKK